MFINKIIWIIQEDVVPLDAGEIPIVLHDVIHMSITTIFGAGIVKLEGIMRDVRNVWLGKNNNTKLKTKISGSSMTDKRKKIGGKGRKNEKNKKRRRNVNGKGNVNKNAIGNRKGGTRTLGLDLYKNINRYH